MSAAAIVSFLVWPASAFMIGLGLARFAGRNSRRAAESKATSADA